MIRTKPGRPKRSTHRHTVPSLAYQAISRGLVKVLPVLPTLDRYPLVICREKRFIWFTVPKVASSTIKTICQQADLALDMPAYPMSCHYPRQMYRDYFKFAFVRNPWDRLVSFWKSNVVVHNTLEFSAVELEEMRAFPNFVRYVYGLNISRADHHLRPQTSAIDFNALDFLGRFEQIDTDIRKVAAAIDIEYVHTVRNQSTDKRNYTEFYDQPLIDMVREIYQRDIHLLQYDFV